MKDALEAAADALDNLARIGRGVKFKRHELKEAARAVLTALGPEWHPIETAPRDGTQILLATWCLHGTPGGPFPDYVVGEWDVEECGGEGGWIIGHCLDRVEGEITNWLPIPQVKR